MLQGVRGVFSTSEAEELTGPEHRGEAAGGPCPQMVFHLLCFLTEPPSSRLWESALRASSDPPRIRLCHRSSFPELQFVSRSCSFHHFLCCLLCTLLVFCSCCCIQSALITHLLSLSCSFCLFLISDSNCSIRCKYVINAKIILAFLAHFIFNDAVSDYL